jgi:hypothetical protein
MSDRVDGVERRQYPATVAAETTAPDQRTAVRRLFEYIDGASRTGGDGDDHIGGRRQQARYYTVGLEAWDMESGDYVVDGDDPEPDLAVVLARPDVTIAECTVQTDDGERTVAEDNPDYDDDEPAVVVAFVDSGLDNHWPDWTEASSEDLYEGARGHGVKCYTFPESRLEPMTDEQAAALKRRDARVAMDDLKSHLENADWDVAFEDGSLIVRKLGVEYRISPTGEVSGTGQMREPLKNVVSQHMG